MLRLDHRQLSQLPVQTRKAFGRLDIGGNFC